MTERLRIGIVGGPRGRILDRAARVIGGLEIVAVCDPAGAAAAPWADAWPEARIVTELDAFWDSGPQAVYVATPVQNHAAVAVAALARDCHVLSEIPAAMTVDEARDLRAAADRSRGVYMLAENYAFIPEVQALVELARQGAFGDLVWGSGHYIHDCRALHWHDDGRLTWRGELKRDVPGLTYPTHTLAPLALGFGLGTRDPLATVQAAQSPATNLERYADALAARKPVERGPFAHGDVALVLAQTRSGALVEVLMDNHCPRPPQKLGLTLHGTLGAYVSGRVRGEDGLIYRTATGAPDPDAVWQPFAPELAAWRQRAAAQDPWLAAGADPDTRMVAAFLAAVAGEAEPPIGIAEALAWSLLVPLSQQSLAQGGGAVAFPAI